MKLSKYFLENVTIIEISGKLDSNTAPEAQQFILPMVELGQDIILDAGNLEYISSAGLRTLLLVAKKLASKGSKAVLTGVSQEIKDIMEMTGFDHMFIYYSDNDQAFQTLQKGK